MTTDIERELRELFREKAGEAPVSTLGTSGAPPPRVLRRGRRHQVGTVFASALVALVLAVGSFAGLRSLLRSDEDPFQTGQEYEVFERTATIEAFTVTSPSDWYLVNQWPLSMLIAVEVSGGVSSPCPGDLADTCQTSNDRTSSPIPLQHGLPMLQLSNTDMGLESVACGADLAAGASVLYVALDYQRSIEGIADPALGPWPGITDEEIGPCGPGSYTRFTVNGEPFFAWIGFGEGVTEDDRSTLLATYEMLSVDDGWEPVPPEQVTPAYVIAGGGSEDDSDWRLELRPSARNVELRLMGVTPSGAPADFTVPERPIEWCCMDEGLIEVTFGAVSKGATGVELRTIDDVVLPGVVVPLPPSLPHDFDLFFIEGTAGLVGEVLALGVEDPATEPQVAEPREEMVFLSGSLLGQGWSARFTGAFRDETACIYVTIDGPYEPFCPEQSETSLAGEQPFFNGTSAPDLFLLAGSVPQEIVEIRYVGDDDAIVPTQLRCAMGPLGWTNPDRTVCAIALPPAGSGTLEYLDAGGAVLFEEGIAWGSAEPEKPAPMVADPVHGGTYWAVYLWLGSAMTEESDQIWKDWSEEARGAQSYGELACDEGAAEALGTDVAFRIAVYFGTETEAQTFALDHGLLGHEADPVIAHVTTLCLD